jgi:hypothetical protein
MAVSSPLAVGALQGTHDSLSGCFRGSCSSWKAGWVCSEGEHGEGDERLVAVESERDAGEPKSSVTASFWRSMCRAPTKAVPTKNGELPQAHTDGAS